MEFVATGCCTRKWLRFDQTIINLTSGDLGILLVMSRLRVTGLKKTKVDLFEGKKDRIRDLVCTECLQMIGLMVVILMCYSRVVNVVLVLWGVGLILRTGYGI